MKEIYLIRDRRPLNFVMYYVYVNIAAYRVYRLYDNIFYLFSCISEEPLIAICDLHMYQKYFQFSCIVRVNT